MNPVNQIRSIARILVAAATATALLAAETPAPAPDLREAQPIVDAFGLIGALIAGADKPAAAKPESSGLLAEPNKSAAAVDEKSAGEPAVRAPRSAKNSVILITSGAAAGAAAGAALAKGSKGAAIGAALGGVAGLIYDRMTYKNPGKI